VVKAEHLASADLEISSLPWLLKDERTVQALHVSSMISRPSWLPSLRLSGQTSP